MGIINYGIKQRSISWKVEGFFSCLKWPFLAAATQRSQADERTKADERCFGVCFFGGLYIMAGQPNPLTYPPPRNKALLRAY